MAKKISASSVYVTSIQKTGASGVHVEASNGSAEGPPFVRFSLPPAFVENCHIGKRYDIEILDPDLAG